MTGKARVPPPAGSSKPPKGGTNKKQDVPPPEMISGFPCPLKVKSKMFLKKSEQRHFRSVILESLHRQDKINQQQIESRKVWDNDSALAFVLPLESPSIETIRFQNTCSVAYLIHGVPMWFDPMGDQEQFLPTVFCLWQLSSFILIHNSAEQTLTWQLPSLIKIPLQHAHLMEFLFNGAYLMGPGVIHKVLLSENPFFQTETMAAISIPPLVSSDVISFQFPEKTDQKVSRLSRGRKQRSETPRWTKWCSSSTMTQSWLSE